MSTRACRRPHRWYSPRRAARRYAARHHRSTRSPARPRGACRPSRTSTRRELLLRCASADSSLRSELGPGMIHILRTAEILHCVEILDGPKKRPYTRITTRNVRRSAPSNSSFSNQRSKMTSIPTDKLKAVETALTQIERQFGKGSIMRLGAKEVAPISSISTGSVGVDAALGVGGVPRGRVIEGCGLGASGKTDF